MSAGLLERSLGRLFGDLCEGLRAVKGILSSLLLSSFFSKAANSGRTSPSARPLPLAPLRTGTVGCILAAGAATGACWACRLKKFSPLISAFAAMRFCLAFRPTTVRRMAHDTRLLKATMIVAASTMYDPQAMCGTKRRTSMRKASRQRRKSTKLTMKSSRRYRAECEAAWK